MALKKKLAYLAKAPVLPFKYNRKNYLNKVVDSSSKKVSTPSFIHLKNQLELNDGTVINKKPIPVLVLECMHEDWLTANTIYCLERDKDWDIHLVSYNNTRSSFRYLPHLKSYRQFPQENGYIQFLEFLQQLVADTEAHVLVPTNTASCQFVILHKERLQQFIRIMPMPDPLAYKIAGDKGLLADFMFQNAIPGPLTLFDLTDRLEDKLNNFPFPVLLKPKTGSGGKGVATGEPPIMLFTNKEALLVFLRQYQIADRYIVQSYVEGYEIDCNVLYKEGKLVAFCIQKALIKADHYAPAFGLEFIHSAEAIAIVEELMSKLNWNGVAHIDLIYDCKREELQILEINPRFWQTMVGALKGANINFPSLACNMALERPTVHVQDKIGKYIPVMPYLKYRFTATNSKRVQFKYKEIDIHYFFAMLPAKAMRSYRNLLLKYGIIGNTVLGQTDMMFWCAYMLSD